MHPNLHTLLTFGFFGYLSSPLMFCHYSTSSCIHHLVVISIHAFVHVYKSLSQVPLQRRQPPVPASWPGIESYPRSTPQTAGSLRDAVPPGGRGDQGGPSALNVSNGGSAVGGI